MQDPAAAAEELERATRELGLKGGYVGAQLPVPLDSPTLDDFYARCVELDVPLFIHPAPPATDAFQVDERLARWDLEIMLGFSNQETLAATTLILGGVLDRHPGLDVCLSHGGGAIAFVAGRLGRATRQRAWAPAALAADGAFEERLARLWFDTHVHDDRSLALLVDVVGTERLVYGSNFAGWDQVADCREEALSLDADLAGNARRLLRLAVD
jgi:aminocarboxymuconate-semialdehyde decarboxylase